MPENIGTRSVEDMRLTTNGVMLHAVAAGPNDGPLVILLHGFPEFWYGWRRQIEPLAEPARSCRSSMFWEARMSSDLPSSKPRLRSLSVTRDMSGFLSRSSAAARLPERRVRAD